MLLLEVLQSSEVRPSSKDGMVHPFRILEVSWILKVASKAIGRKAWCSVGVISVSVSRLNFFFSFVWRERYVLWPEGWIDAVFEDQMWTDICKRIRFLNICVGVYTALLTEYFGARFNYLLQESKFLKIVQNYANLKNESSKVNFMFNIKVTETK